jgi:hypothetical protein
VSSAEFAHDRIMAVFAAGATRRVKSLPPAALLQHTRRAANQKTFFHWSCQPRRADGDDRRKSITGIRQSATDLNFELRGPKPGIWSRRVGRHRPVAQVRRLSLAERSVFAAAPASAEKTVAHAVDLAPTAEWPTRAKPWVLGKIQRASLTPEHRLASDEATTHACAPVLYWRPDCGTVRKSP